MVLVTALLLFSAPANAQVSEESSSKENSIEKLSIYPNPATSGEIIYITTRFNDHKKIEIFNVLGKNVLSTTLSGNELNISSLDPGIYILKLKEGNHKATRKLVIQ